MMEKSTVNIFNDILDSDILTYLLKDSKMDLDGVRLKIAYMKNQEILQNHPYEIWQERMDVGIPMCRTIQNQKEGER